MEERSNACGTHPNGSNPIQTIAALFQAYMQTLSRFTHLAPSGFFLKPRFGLSLLVAQTVAREEGQHVGEEVIGIHKLPEMREAKTTKSSAVRGGQARNGGIK